MLKNLLIGSIGVIKEKLCFKLTRQKVEQQ